MKWKVTRRLTCVICASGLVAFLGGCDLSKGKESKHKRKEREAVKETVEHGQEPKKSKAEKGRDEGPSHDGGGRGTSTVRARDWTRCPAVLERNADADVVGLGDVHGGFDRLVALLSGAGLIKPGGASGYAWSGGRTVLVSVGDLINKGDQSIRVLDLMMALETQAPSAGGAVIVTLGNHEAEFMADPRNKKARREFSAELRAKGIDPEAVAAGAAPYGEWLANRPVAARVNTWFFAHGGNTSGNVTAQLAREFQDAIDGGHWDSPFLIGDNSILEAQKWWKKGNLDPDLVGVQAHHIVFGHDPGAFDQPGRIVQQQGGKLFLIDVGMSPAVDYSKGALLLIHRAGNVEEVSSVDPSGRKTPVWRGAP